MSGIHEFVGFDLRELFLLPSQLAAQYEYTLTIVFLILVLNGKGLPFLWHLRLLAGLRFLIFRPRLERTDDVKGAPGCFNWIVMRSRCSVADIDLNLHKNNSTYVSDADIARWHFVADTLLPTLRNPKNLRVEGTTAKKPLSILLGGVSADFKKGIGPFSTYEIWTKMMCWDDKWVYFESHFVRPKRHRGRKDEGQHDLHATVVSKCVFKQGRKTVPPAKVLEAAGLLTGKSSLKAAGDTTKVLWDSSRIEEENLAVLSYARSPNAEDAPTRLFEPARWPVRRRYRDISLFML